MDYFCLVPELSELKELAGKSEASTKAFFKTLKKKIPTGYVDDAVRLHYYYFERYDCLTCANCCAGLGPLILERDIDLIAKKLKLAKASIIDKYLRIDEDGDFVFKSMPCPFLCSDNYCSIYESRPQACREYPHTDHKRPFKILDITLKNTFVCPIVYAVVETLKNRFNP